ncbi:MAG TPA: hypothetical protein VJ761_18850 [Ktedonobacteraceae bacterium]|nr:hypothetical protein [Ktedonobacteraceae bacterium]
MPHKSIPLAHLVSPGCVAFLEPDNALWLGTEAGEIISLRLLDGRVTVLGGGYLQPVAALPLSNGLGVLVVERSGRLLIASRDAVDAANSVIVADLARPLAAACLHPDGQLALVLEAGNTSQLLQIDLATGAAQAFAEELADPTALTIAEATRQAIIVERTGAGLRLATVDLDAGTIDRPATALDTDTVSLVSAPDATAGVIVATGLAGNLAFVSVTGQPDVPGPTVGVEVRGLARWGSLILVVTSSSVEAVEWGLDEGDLPISLPLGPVFVGGYLQAEIQPNTIGLDPAEVELIVEEGPVAGSVSAGIEPPGPAGTQRIRVLAGWIPGEYHLSAIHRTDGKRLGIARYRVTAHWPDDEVGPSIAVTGPQQIFLRGGWGGGPSGPQNLRVHPAPEEWRVAVVLVTTSDQRYPSNVDGDKNSWQDMLEGGSLSVRRYYEEVSFQPTTGVAGGPTGTTVSLAGSQVFGPLNLPHGWGDYFESGDINDPWGGWLPKSTTWQECAATFSEFLQDRGWAETVLRNTDAVVFVMKTASNNIVTVGDKQLRAMYSWPVAGGANVFWKTAYSTGIKAIPCVFMPSGFPSSMPGDSRWPLVPALCHEIGHTFGCEDLYNRGDFPAEIMTREIASLDLMDEDSPLPHLSLPNRMRLGWIAPNWIEVFDFGVNPSGHPVTLQAMETLTRKGPPPGRKAGIEVRLRDGWNYYFEYRRKQGGQVGDQQLRAVEVTESMVVGTDVIADGVGEVNRPRILLLPVDADGDGPTLNATNEDYEESDVTNPERMHDFRLIYDQLEPGDDNAVRVKVEYVRANRAELQIRPAPGRGDWKSPDINLEGPSGLNRLEKGLKHTIVVRVKNAGTVAAENVRISVKWLPFTTSPGAWMELTDPPRQTIAAGATTEFRVDWQVPQNLQIEGVDVNHFCVRAEIDRYIDPRDPSRNEIVISNNWAQSNFDSTNVASGSPSERRNTGIIVTNRLTRPTTFLTVVEQTSPYFRAYLGNAWLRLQPGQTRLVNVSYESLAGDPIHGEVFEREFERIAHEPPNNLSFTTLVAPPERRRCSTPRIEWGANLSIQVGHLTRVREVNLSGEVIRGFVEGQVNGQTRQVTGGQVNVVLWLAERPEEQFVCSGNVDANGWFSAVTTPEIREVLRRNETGIVGEALYLGTWFWSPCRSGTRRLA